MASSQSGIIIKHLAELQFTHHHGSRNKNICQSVCIFGIIGKWKICYVWDNSQDFDNFEEFLCMLFDTKPWSCYWKGIFAPMF